MRFSLSTAHTTISYHKPVYVRLCARAPGITYHLGITCIRAVSFIEINVNYVNSSKYAAVQTQNERTSAHYPGICLESPRKTSKHLSRQSIDQPRFEPYTSRLEVCIVTATPASSTK